MGFQLKWHHMSCTELTGGSFIKAGLCPEGSFHFWLILSFTFYCLSGRREQRKLQDPTQCTYLITKIGPEKAERTVKLPPKKVKKNCCAQNLVLGGRGKKKKENISYKLFTRVCNHQWPSSGSANEYWVQITLSQIWSLKKILYCGAFMHLEYANKNFPWTHLQYKVQRIPTNKFPRNLSSKQNLQITQRNDMSMINSWQAVDNCKYQILQISENTYKLYYIFYIF